MTGHCHCLRVRGVSVARAAVFLALAGSRLMAAGVFETSSCLPPADGAYVGQSETWGPVLLSDPVLSQFTSCMTPQSTTVGGSWTESFNATLTGELFIGNVDQGPTTGAAAVTVLFTVASDSGGVETLDTQMTRLDINFQGGSALGRIDPVTPSTGETDVTDEGGGNFQMTSFFDIFTDLSLDGGSTWIPGTGTGPGGSAVMTLQAVPEPASVMLFGGGLLLLGTRKLRRTRHS
jgi:PEP-CTERM motif